jgi:pyridoxine 5-phosphate synthase
MRVRLHVNVDHVATIRQARGTDYPDPVEAAALCESAGAHGITVHLREDRRHIQLRDVEALRKSVKTILNLEMAATEEMIGIALEVKPDLVTLVPERREERTTEGGLDVRGQLAAIRSVRERLSAGSVPTSLFVDPDPAQVDASIEVGAACVELHTGDYAAAAREGREGAELDRLVQAASRAGRAPGLRVAAGHGLTTANVVALVARAPEIEELNIGHALVADAVLVGLERAVQGFLRAIERGEHQR